METEKKQSSFNLRSGDIILIKIENKLDIWVLNGSSIAKFKVYLEMLKGKKEKSIVLLEKVNRGRVDS